MCETTGAVMTNCETEVVYLELQRLQSSNEYSRFNRVPRYK